MEFQILKNIVEEQTLRFNSITENDWNFKVTDSKWSKKEILGHLCDSAFINLRRFVVTQYKENENIVYDQDAWVKAQNYQNISTENIINLWKVLNLQIVNVVENIPHKLLLKTCDTSKNEQRIVTLEFLIQDYIDHLNHHLEQI